MTDYTNLVDRLRAAAEDMQHGVHTPGHIALVKEAAKALEAIDKLVKEVRKCAENSDMKVFETGGHGDPPLQGKLF